VKICVTFEFDRYQNKWRPHTAHESAEGAKAFITKYIDPEGERAFRLVEAEVDPWSSVPVVHKPAVTPCVPSADSIDAGLDIIENELENALKTS